MGRCECAVAPIVVGVVGVVVAAAIAVGGEGGLGRGGEDKRGEERSELTNKQRPWRVEALPS